MVLVTGIKFCFQQRSQRSKNGGFQCLVVKVKFFSSVQVCGILFIYFEWEKIFIIQIKDYFLDLFQTKSLERCLYINKEKTKNLNKKWSKGIYRQFTEEAQMANKTIKIITMRLSFTSSRMINVIQFRVTLRVCEDVIYGHSQTLLLRVSIRITQLKSH